MTAATLADCCELLKSGPDHTKVPVAAVLSIRVSLSQSGLFEYGAGTGAGLMKTLPVAVLEHAAVVPVTVNWEVEGRETGRVAFVLPVLHV